MDNKDIIKRVLSEADDFQSKSADELRERLDNELSKPAGKTDYGLVDELTKEILEAEGKEPLTVDVEQKLSELQTKIAKSGKRFYFPKWAIGISAACITLFCANFISVAAWDMNIFSAVIEFTKGGFSVDFGKDKQEIIELPVSEDDPYGIIAECAKYNIFPETPQYLPDGFVLENISSNVNENFANTVSMTFTKENMIISFDFKRYWNEIGKTGIPSDKYNISETTINGNTAIISKEDEQYTITFMNGKTSFLMFTQDVPYDECEKIVASIK